MEKYVLLREIETGEIDYYVCSNKLDLERFDYLTTEETIEFLDSETSWDDRCENILDDLFEQAGMQFDGEQDFDKQYEKMKNTLLNK